MFTMTHLPLMKLSVHLTRHSSRHMPRIFLKRQPLATLGKADAKTIRRAAVMRPGLHASCIWVMATPTASTAASTNYSLTPQ